MVFPHFYHVLRKGQQFRLVSNKKLTQRFLVFYHWALDVFCCIVVLVILVGENLDVREDKKETSLRFSRFVASPPCVSEAGIHLRGSV